ncbi:MAG: YkgJ family cysteine cluster protein [Betaproteobacteria bacterium]|nr:YkgJ family cysteine cluster protein [Betaproteobacteria bacterium]
MNPSELPFPTSPVTPTTLEGTAALQFQCRKGIACWNACCSNIDISLTPYDIVRLKQHLELSSSEFLNRYTVPYEMEKDGIAGVKLRPVDGGTACRFMTDAGCGVYADRPTACRYYPVALLSMRKQDESVDRQYYAIVREDHCLGHREPRTQTIDEYRAEQGLPEYDDLAHGWRQLILKKKSSGPTVGKPSKRSLELFFMTCYDIDRFRSFVASDSFSGIYELPADELHAMLLDDVTLLQFGFRFLRQVLFGEMTIPMRAESVEQRRARLAEQRSRIEREAAERLARDDDEGGAYVDV